MSKGNKGKKGNIAQKTQSIVPQVQSGNNLATPETASPDIGEHYYHAAGERAPAGYYENTTMAITNHVHGKGYREAAESVEGGYDIHPTTPLAPVTPKKVLEEKTGKKNTNNFFDVFTSYDSDEDDDPKKVKEESATEPEAIDDEVAKQLLATLTAIHNKEIDL